MKSDDREQLLVDLVTERELAKILRRHERTIARWRRTRTGPPYVLIGRGIFYNVRSVRKWIDSSEVDLETERRRHDRKRSWRSGLQAPRFRRRRKRSH